jgi:HK97 gp10 family phage protein
MPADNGLADFRRRIDQVRAAAKKAVGPALDKSAQELVDTMKVLVPVDKGTLKDSIRWTSTEELTRRVSAGDATTEKTVTGSHGGENYTVDEALMVEFGTQKMSGRPYFWPSYRNARKRIKSRIKRAITKGIKEAYNGK